jgi:hypothetical protein
MSIDDQMKAALIIPMEEKDVSTRKAEKGLFPGWLKKNGKLGGQHKVPRLSNNRDFIEELLAQSNTNLIL